MKLPIMKIGLDVFLVSILVIFSCTETDQVVPDLGLDYFPLHVGNYSIYEVYEATILQSVKTESSYELKVTVSDSAVDERGEVTYFLLREKRVESTDVWEGVDTWSTRVINNQVIQNEANVSYIKLIFPPSLNLKWDGNQYNNLPGNGELFYDGDDAPYFISEIKKPVSLSTGIESDNSLTVIQNDLTDNFTGIDERKEIYAKDIGLVYKEFNQIRYCTAPSCYGQQKIDQGVILTQRLKEYGKK